MCLKRLTEGGDPVATILVVGRHRHEHADTPYAIALLRARREWPSRRAVEASDEFAP
jgi:hypothetical protein